PLLRVQMVGKAENRPISASEHYFDEKRFPDFIERMNALRSVSKVYAHYDIGDYTRKWSRITATLPSPEVARILGQPKTRPILQVEALNVDQAGAPLQYSITRFVGDLVQLMVADDS
ncbi:UTRA domain-containing protein, partial [Achromobacter sp.]